MIAFQPELTLSPNDLDHDLASLIQVISGILARGQTWRTAADLCKHPEVDLPCTENGFRLIREASALSDGLIISGQKGYRHFDCSTPEERTHAANRLDHQGDTMKARAAAIRRRIATTR